MLQGCPENVRRIRFIELWTLKEAFLKAVGVGLSRSLSSMLFAFGEDASIDLTTADAAEAHGFQFALFEPVPGTRLAVAARSEGRAGAVVHATDFDGAHAIPALRTSSSWRGSRRKRRSMLLLPPMRFAPADEPTAMLLLPVVMNARA